MCETVSPERPQNCGWLFNAGASSNSASSVNIDYSATRFLDDLQKGCQSIGAPFDEETTKAVLEAYEDDFNEGAIQLRTTSRAGDPLFYRLFTRHPINAIETAVKRGFLSSQKEIAPLINAWNSKWDDSYEQLDFASDGGVASAFLYLGVPKHINDLLFGVSHVPESLRSIKPKFDDFGLELVQAVLADYNANKIAFYFIAKGPLTKDLAANFCALAGCPPPSEELYSDMSTTLASDPFFFMVSMDFKTGKIGEVQFYILFPVEIRGDSLPKVGDRLTTYWNVESYEEEEMDILGWCFPSNGEPYLQADRGYCGGLRNILRDWKLIDDGDKSGYLHS